MWTDFSSILQPRYHAAATTLYDKIYLIGGISKNGSYLRRLEIWDGKWVWSRIKFRIQQAWAVDIGDQIFVFGGQTDKSEF